MVLLVDCLIVKILNVEVEKCINAGLIIGKPACRQTGGTIKQYAPAQVEIPLFCLCISR
jgi:hypothetical protein